MLKVAAPKGSSGLMSAGSAAAGRPDGQPGTVPGGAEVGWSAGRLRLREVTATRARVTRTADAL